MIYNYDICFILWWHVKVDFLVSKSRFTLHLLHLKNTLESGNLHTSDTFQMPWNSPNTGVFPIPRFIYTDLKSPTRWFDVFIKRSTENTTIQKYILYVIIALSSIIGVNTWIIFDQNYEMHPLLRYVTSDC